MSLKVLTIDDSKTIRMIVKKAFKPYDCELLEAENGLEGLEVTRQEQPDLIVLDITMPVMNGIEMLGELKEDPKLKEIPVIMLTAESGKDNVMQIVKMGVTDYIVKPFKGEQLIERAEKIVSLVTKESIKSAEDHSKKYIKADGDFHRVILPEKINRQVAVEVDGCLQNKIMEMLKKNMNKMIIDLRVVKEINVALIKLIILMVTKFKNSSIQYRIVGTPSIKDEFAGFQETADIEVLQGLDEAKAAL